MDDQSQMSLDRMIIPHQKPQNLPDQFDDFAHRMACWGITITPLPNYGVWGFLAENDGQRLQVFWDNRDDLLEIMLPVNDSGEWQLDSVHPINTMTRDRVFEFLYKLLTAKLTPTVRKNNKPTG